MKYLLSSFFVVLFNFFFVKSSFCKPQYLSSNMSLVDSSNREYYEFETYEQTKRMIAFKLEPTLLFAGDIPLFVEYKLNNRFSMELGVGFTNYEFNHFGENKNYVSLESSGKDSKKGYSIRVSPRYYFRNVDVAISGFYLSPEFLIRTYSSLGEYNLVGGNTDYFWASNKQQRINFIVGYQKFIGDKLICNIYSGYGFGNDNKQGFIQNNNGQYDGTSVFNKEKNNRFLIGIKFGFSIHK